MEKIVLPKVSILTPTFNRRSFAELSIKNIIETNYPKDKIEWLILDD
jgi:glycosyltransferase involved in cell wall biosynthesis